MDTADRRLGRLSREFAESIQHLLNATICHDVRITAVASNEPGEFVVGFKLGRSSLRGSRFPIAGKPGKARCWLRIGYRLRMDQGGEYLMVDASYVSAYAADEDGTTLCRFDYERRKEGYPEAHLQVYGKSAALAAWSGNPRRELERLHFPMGGRRYRPTLEDFIEFLILEGLAEARSGWRDVLDAGRDAYRRVQLRAAIRRDPVTAVSAIGDPLFA